MKCWIVSGRPSGMWCEETAWEETAASGESVSCTMGLRLLGRWMDRGRRIGSAAAGAALRMRVVLLVRVERIQGGEAVASRGEFDLERLGARLDEGHDLLVLLDGLARTARDEAEGGVAKHLQPVPPAVHQIEDVGIGAFLEQDRVELQVEL